MLDGAFYAWADPTEKDNPESGAYPFVFDVLGYKNYLDIVFPQTIELQLSAFAQDLEYYESEEAFSDGQEGEVAWAAQSFIPSGLFNIGEDGEPQRPESFGVLTGVVKQAEKRTNVLTSQKFYWMLVDTLGGQVDVVADHRFFDTIAPQAGGIVYGQFWLSGSLLGEPKTK